MRVSTTASLFQFPSNGKTYINKIKAHRDAVEAEFQFPSNGKTYINLMTSDAVCSFSDSFQFPSNGKTYINLQVAEMHTRRLKVSIPFKRENIYQHKYLSLLVEVPCPGWFQFPSNGKAYINRSPSHGIGIRPNLL